MGKIELEARLNCPVDRDPGRYEVNGMTEVEFEAKVETTIFDSLMMIRFIAGSACENKFTGLRNAGDSTLCTGAEVYNRYLLRCS